MKKITLISVAIVSFLIIGCGGGSNTINGTDSNETNTSYIKNGIDSNETNTSLSNVNDGLARNSETAIWNIDVYFTGRFLSDEWHWTNVKIAGTKEPLKTVYDSEYPFPYMHQHGGMTLVDTSFYDNSDNGLILAYYANAYPSSSPALIQKGYCIDTDWLEQLITDDGDTYISCAEKKYQPTWDGINTSLNMAQETSFINHKSFTIEDTGRWINDRGYSSLTITFTPVN